MIRHNFMKGLALAFIVFLIFYACTSEQDYIVNDKDAQQVEPLTTANAHAWYEKNFGTTPQLKSGGEEELAVLMPDWNLSHLYEDSLWYAVELPLNTAEHAHVYLMTKEVNEYAEANGDKSLTRQVLRLIVLRNKESGDTYSFMMAVLPDLDYMLKKGESIEENKYLTRDSDFSGLAYFYTVDGAFVNGWMYRDGKIVAGTHLEEDNAGTKAAIIVDKAYCYYQDIYIGGVFQNTRYICEYSQDILYTRDPSKGGGGGIIRDPGSPGSGGSTSSSSSAPKAKKIFRNSKMTAANWKILENMLDKMTNNCMGQALYNGLVSVLNGSTITIEFNSGNGSYFTFNNGVAGISVNITGESNQLLHEMMHAHRAYSETLTSYDGSRLNGEIEAFYAQYLYVSSLPEYSGSQWERMYKKIDLFESIKGFEEYVDSKGNLKPGKTSFSFDTYMLNEPVAKFLANPVYKYYPYDYSRGGLDNLRNLRELTKNC